MRNVAKLSKSRAVVVAMSLAAASVFAAAPAEASWGPFDGGGRVTDYFDQVSQANSSGSTVEIAGVCASACTMKLGARHASSTATPNCGFMPLMTTTAASATSARAFSCANILGVFAAG